MSLTRKVQTHRDRKNVKQVKSKVKSMLIIFFDTRLLFTENSSGHSKLSFPHTTLDVLRPLRGNVRRLRLELWRLNKWLLYRDNVSYHTSYFTRNFLTRNNMSTPPPIYFSVSLIEDKTKRCTIEVIEAETQAVLNALREHDFQNGRSAGNGVYACKTTSSRVMVTCRPKVSF
jgi:hypothetical protein